MVNQRTNKMKFIDAVTIRNAASYREWLEAMKRALIEAPVYDQCMLKRQHIDFGRNTFLLMPCVNEKFWVTKLVSYCPENPGRGKPSIYGTVVLNSSRTGELLAVLDGGMITAMRTAAVGASGLDVLAPGDVKTLGIAGTGTQGMYQALFACQVRDFKTISFYDKDETAVSAFADFAAREFPGTRLQKVEDAEELAHESEVLITATNSGYPLFSEDEGLLAGKTIIAVGSYKPGFRELPSSLFSHIKQVFVDTVHAASESGDLVIPLQAGLIPMQNIHPLGKLISGEIALEKSPSRLFKTVGSAVYDLFAAQLVFGKTMNNQPGG
jgi:ornithine cyclodeaminase/alanine dehydrogenase-like protein (mu-crystallin family)